MYIVYLPFVLLIFVLISSLYTVVLAFLLKRYLRFNWFFMFLGSGLISLLLSYWFHISNLSNYGYLSSGGIDKVIDGVITLDGYLSTFYYSLVFALFGSLIGLLWFYIFKRLDSADKVET